MSDTRVATRTYQIGPTHTSFVVPPEVIAPGFTFLIANSAVGTVTVTTSATDTRGAKLIILGAGYLSFRTGTVGDSHGNTWIPLGLSGFSFDACRQWYCFNPVTSSFHQFQLSDVGAQNIFGNLCMAAFTGTTAFSTIDQDVGSAGGTSLFPSASAITPTKNNELIVASCVFGSGGSTGTITAISDGFTIATQQNYSNNNWQGGGLAYKTQAPAVTVDPFWTIDTTYDWTARISCFKSS